MIFKVPSNSSCSVILWPLDKILSFEDKNLCVYVEFAWKGVSLTYETRHLEPTVNRAESEEAEFVMLFFVPFCSDTEVKCYKNAGVTYRGTWSVTESGAECLNWNINGLMDHKYSGQRKDAAELGLGNHNYCR